MLLLQICEFNKYSKTPEDHIALANGCHLYMKTATGNCYNLRDMYIECTFA